MPRSRKPSSEFVSSFSLSFSCQKKFKIRKHNNLTHIVSCSNSSSTLLFFQKKTTSKRHCFILLIFFLCTYFNLKSTFYIKREKRKKTREVSDPRRYTNFNSSHRTHTHTQNMHRMLYRIIWYITPPQKMCSNQSKPYSSNKIERQRSKSLFPNNKKISYDQHTTVKQTCKLLLQTVPSPTEECWTTCVLIWAKEISGKT